MATNEDFLNTIMQLESGGRQGLTSSAGATGRMQTMGATRQDPGFGVLPAQDESLEEGDRVGRDYALALLNHYDNDPALALAAYNSGPGTVNKYGGVPPYEETQNYVTRGLSMLGASPASDEEVTPEDLAWYEEYTNKQAAPTTDEVTPEDLAWYEEYTKKQGEPVQEDRTAKQVGSDILTTAGKGIIGVPQSLVGLADIPTGGKVGKYLEEKGYNFEKMQKELSEQYSPQQKEDIKALQEASGVADNLKAAWEHPEAVASMVGESIPSIFAGGMFGKAAKAAGLVKSTAGAAGLGEALVAGGQSAEDIRVQSPDRELSTKGSLSALGAGAATGVLGFVGSKATSALGGIDVDTLLVGGARRAISKEVGEEAAKTPGVFRRVLTSAFGEGILEEATQSAQEKMWQNYATDKPLMEGVEDAATKGAILGSVTGAAVGALPAGKEGVVTPSIPSPVVQAPELSDREEEYRKSRELKRRSSEIEAAGIPTESKLHDDLLSLDYNKAEDLATAKTLVDEAAQTDEYEDLDLENFDEHIAKHETKLAEQAATPEAQVVTPEAETAEVVAPEEQLVTPTAETAEVVVPEEQIVAQKQQTVEPRWLKRPEEIAFEKEQTVLEDAWNTEPSKRTSEQLKIMQTAADEDLRVKSGVQDYGKPIVEPVTQTTKEQIVTPENKTFSVAPSEKMTVHTADSLRKSLTPEMKRLEAIGKFVLHDTQDTLPGTDHPANVQGMTTAEGVTHYVANKLNPITLQNVALHEVGVHTGLEKMVGAKVWEDVKNQAMNNEGTEFDAARASIPKNTPAHLHAEEALAYLVENSSHLPFIRRLIASVRNWARTTFGTNIRMSQDDARHLATRALRKESKTKELTARKEGTAYALSPRGEQGLASTEARREAATPAPKVKTPRTTGESITRGIDILETSLTSYDSAWINKLRRDLVKSGLPVESITKLMLKASQSQTVHAGSVAAQGTIRGGLKKNDVTEKWEAFDVDNKMPNVRLMLDDIAKDNDKTFKQIANQFGDIMVASRIFELRQRPTQIKEKIDRADERIEAVSKKIEEQTSAEVKIELRKEKAKEERIKKSLEKKYKKALDLANNQHLSVEQVQEQLDVLEDHPEYKKPMNEWRAIRKNMIEFLVETERYSDAQAEAYLDAIAYVPFNRIMDQKDPEAAYATMSQGHGKASAGLTKGQTEYGIKGSLKEVDDTVTNMEKWVMNSFVKGINASKARELMQLSLTNMPEGTVTELGTNPKNKEGAVNVYYNGKKYYFRYADPLLPFCFNGVNPVALPALKFGAKFANKLRQFIVLNPLFTVSQLPQDTFSAMFSSGLRNPFMLPLETLKEFGKTLASTSATHEKLKGRGVVGQRDFMDDVTKSIHDIAYNQHSETKGVGASILRGLNHFSMAGDNALRQAIYNRTMKELKNRPDADAIATERALEVINFRRRGASATADMIRQVTPFLGAYLQAQRVAFNTLSGRGIAPSERKEALATLALTTAQVIAMTFVYNGLLDDDDEFKKKNAREKDTRLFLMGSKANFTMPLRPDVFSFPFVLGNHAYRAMLDKGTENPEVARRAMKDAFLAAVVGMPMGPTIIKPIVEVAIDHDWFTGRGLIPQRLEGFDKELQYTDGTSEIAKMLGKTGYISPIAVDHLVKGFFGYVGGATLSLTDIALRASMDLPYASKAVYGKDINDIPGISPLYARENKPQIIDSFFKFNAEVDKTHRTYSEYKKTGRREEAREYKTEGLNKLLLNDRVRKDLHHMSTKVGDLKEKRRKIMETPNERISPEAKKERVDKIDERILHVIKNIDRLQGRVYK